jgi:hypothetical protein
MTGMTNTPPGQTGQSSSRTLLIVAAVVLVCCVCAGLGAAGWWLWNNGDQFLQGIGQILIRSAA